MRNKYYSIFVDEGKKEASINIYGTITSWPFIESDVSSYTLAKEIETLDVDVINVHLNSYGGEVAEGWAIYNTLKAHRAKIKTIADGMVCSICAVIFAVGEERIMKNLSLLMIHNAWTSCTGNAEQLRKEANDLEKMSKLSAQAFSDQVSITEEELNLLLAEESILTPQEALDMGFATSIEGEQAVAKASQSAKRHVMQLITKAWQKENAKEDDPESDPEKDPEDDPEKDPEDDPEKDPEDDPEGDPDDDPEDDPNAKKKTDTRMSKQKLSSFFNALSKLD